MCLYSASIRLLPRILLVGAIPWWCLLYSSNAAAWGNLGHRVTALVAEQLLSNGARQQVRQLLGDESLADAAIYMDTHRDELAARWPDSARWHYDNRRVCYSNSRYCSDGNCASQQLERFRQVLADPKNSQQDRALALRMVVHILGDLHQPLHMADNHDHGGNDVWARLYPGTEQHRLHEVFDTELVKKVMGQQLDQTYAHNLVTRYRPQILDWQQGTIADWANESYQLGATEIYGHLPHFACNRSDTEVVTLPTDYLQRARDYVPVQLTKAGVRIAALLNATLH